MQATRLFAIRHGETGWNAERRIQGQRDIELNARGRWQALQLPRALADEAIDAVYASDLRRAHDTARALADATGLAVRLDVGLRERAFGRFEGHTFEEIEAKWPEESVRWRQRDPFFGPPGGETLAGFYQRSVEAAQRLAQAHAGRTIVLVAHGGVLDALYRAATRQDLQSPRTWEVPNASVNRLLWSPEGFSLVGWNDQQHLLT